MSEGLLVNTRYKRRFAGALAQIRTQETRRNPVFPGQFVAQYQRRNGKPSAVLLTVRLACVR